MSETTTDETAGQHRAPDQGLLARINLSEPVRLRLWAATAAAVALLVAYGLLDEHTAPLWLALVTGALGITSTELTRAAVVSPVTARRVAVDAVELAARKPMHPFTAAGLALEHNSVPQG